MPRLLWCALLVLGLGACAGSPARMDPLSVTLSDIRPVQMGLLEQEYAIRIRVQNPNNTAIPLAGLSYQIELNGEPFARGVSKQTAAVPAFGEIMLDATAVGNIGGLMAQVVQVQRSGLPQAFSYRLKGKLTTAQAASLPFDHSGSVELPDFEQPGAQR